ncbi:MAG TPA: hypothetical protein VFO64_06700 [Gaiellaceae bacterium]|jgi:hypothetical protein|nr:hypothetical protein [Gaiellaceae bacterium]
MGDPTVESLEERYDNPLERLQLLGSDDEAIAAFLDEIDVRSPRDREMLRELARTSSLARPERFEEDHRSVLVALESLRRHGHHGATADARLGILRVPVRYFVELVARYVVVSYCKSIATNLRNLYWLREMESPRGSREQALLQAARLDAQALVEIARGREIGVPTFVIGAVVVPAGLSVWRLASGTVREWWVALVAGAASVAVGLLISWIVLRGAALASRRIRLSVREPLAELWRTVGHCGSPPKDHSRRFAVVAITLTLGVWIVLPLLVTLSLAN